MTVGFLTLVGTLLSIIFYEIKRKDTKSDDLNVQNQKRHERIAKDIYAKKSLDSSLHADDDIAKLERLLNYNSNPK